MSAFKTHPDDIGNFRALMRCIDQTDADGVRLIVSRLGKELMDRGFCDRADLGHWFAGGNKPNLEGHLEILCSYLLYKAALHSIKSAEDPMLVDNPGDVFEVLRRMDLSRWGLSGLCSSVGLSPDLYSGSAKIIRSLEEHKAFWLDPSAHLEERDDAVHAFRNSWSEVVQESLLSFLVNESCLSLSFRSTSILTCRETDGRASIRGATGYATYARAFLGVGSLQISWMFTERGLQASISPQPL